jgi:cysteine-rich repeat protein
VVDGYNGAVTDYTVSVSCGAADPVCRNGTLEPGEECDDGNATGGDGCSVSCTLEAGTCASTWTLGCGESDSWTTAYGQNRITRYGCSIFSETGKEYTYEFTAPRTGPVTVTMGNVDPSVDLDLFVLLSPFGACAAGDCIAAGDAAGMDTVTFDALEGQTYYLVVDGFSGAAGTFDIGVTCP